VADTKLSDLAALTSPATGDLFELLDVSDTSMSADGTNKQVTLSTLRSFLGIVPPAVKTADQTLTQSDTTPEDVTGLSQAVEASRRYRIEVMLLTNAANATSDWKFGWSGVPAGAAGLWGGIAGGGTADFAVQGAATNQKALADFTATIAAGSAGVTGGFLIVGYLKTAGTAGTLQFQASQNTSNASDNKILEGSSMLLLPLS
jgi:hypothetical protein